MSPLLVRSVSQAIERRPAPRSAISAGAYHSLALTKNGSIIAWGCRGHDSGQCRVPTSVRHGMTAIAAGWIQTLVLKSGL